MPPHAQMSLAQMLLLRALVVRFWKTPYRHPLVRWGTALHDRFLLPHYVWADFPNVVDELAAAGYPFRAEWYEPFLEFRFPHYGRADYDGVEIALRMALEPWLVLGEEATPTGRRASSTRRSSASRSPAADFDPERFLVTCNGRCVPLQPTGIPRRGRRRRPLQGLEIALGLHPTVPCTRRSCSTWSTAGSGGPSAAACTTRRTPAASPTKLSR